MVRTRCWCTAIEIDHGDMFKVSSLTCGRPACQEIAEVATYTREEVLEMWENATPVEVPPHRSLTGWLGRIDTRLHASRLPYWTYRWLCDWYDRRVIGGAP